MKAATGPDKPIVHYRGSAKLAGGRALLYPIDHPSRLPQQAVSNLTMARTSEVISWVEGRIETENTIYVPEEK